MLEDLGRAVHRWRWAVLTLGLAALIGAAVCGAGLFGHLAGAGFTDPGSESARAEQLADLRLPRDGADVVALYTGTDTRAADDPDVRRAVEDTLAALPAGAVSNAVTPWTPGGSGLVSADRRSVAVVLRLTGADASARRDAYDLIHASLSRAPDGLSVALGGDVAVGADISERVEHDIRRAELISLPVLLVLLVVLIGSVVAGVLPILLGALVITGAFAVLRALTVVADVSVFSVNVVTMLGLGLAVDYALLVITRFREELREQPTTADAVARTVATAGRTVLVSGLIVAVTLATLLLFPQVYFRSVGLAGVAVTALAVLAAVTVLPAMLGVLGPRVDRLRLPRRIRPPARARHLRPAPDGWFRFAAAVMRRPVAVAAVVVTLLMLAGVPFLRVNFGDIDHRALPADVPSRVVTERLAADFPQGGPEPVEVVVTLGADDPVRLAEYLERLRGLPGVTAAGIDARAGDTVRIGVRHRYDGQSAALRHLVGDIRLTTPPPHAQVLVGGGAAELTDLLDSLRRTLPWMAAAILGVTFLVLLLAFGSVLLPVKAVALGVLSLTASFGAVVWVFQDGHLSGLLGFTPTGAVEATQPVLIFAIAFALSTDYEVFLLARVREEWNRSRDTTLAVAAGVQRTAPIITSAALLLVVVIGAFSLSGVSFVKMIGLGLVITIVVDATVIRALLVPATMRLLGPAAWWAPAPLAGLARRLRLHEAPAPAVLLPATEPDAR